MINKFATVAWKEQKALKIFDGKGTGARNSQTSLKYGYHRWVEQHSSFQEIGCSPQPLQLLIRHTCVAVLHILCAVLCISHTVSRFMYSMIGSCVHVVMGY